MAMRTKAARDLAEAALSAAEKRARKMTPRELREAHKAVVLADSRNCWWAIFQARFLLDSVISDEKFRRKFRRRAGAPRGAGGGTRP